MKIEHTLIYYGTNNMIKLAVYVLYLVIIIQSCSDMSLLYLHILLRPRTRRDKQWYYETKCPQNLQKKQYHIWR